MHIYIYIYKYISSIPDPLTNAERWNAYLEVEESTHRSAAQLAQDARQAMRHIAAATNALSSAFAALTLQYSGQPGAAPVSFRLDSSNTYVFSCGSDVFRCPRRLRR